MTGREDSEARRSDQNRGSEDDKRKIDKIVVLKNPGGDKGPEITTEASTKIVAEADMKRLGQSQVKVMTLEEKDSKKVIVAVAECVDSKNWARSSASKKTFRC